MAKITTWSQCAQCDTVTTVLVDENATREEIARAYEEVGAHVYPSRCAKHNEFKSENPE